MAKNNMKCVRINDDILDIVEKYKIGEGFNQKFENLVMEYKNTIPDREKKLKDINIKIKKKEKELEELETKISLFKDINFNIETLKKQILDVDNLAKKAVKQ